MVDILLWRNIRHLWLKLRVKNGWCPTAKRKDKSSITTRFSSRWKRINDSDSFLTTGKMQLGASETWKALSIRSWGEGFYPKMASRESLKLNQETPLSCSKVRDKPVEIIVSKKALGCYTRTQIGYHQMSWSCNMVSTYAQVTRLPS